MKDKKGSGAGVKSGLASSEKFAAESASPTEGPKTQRPKVVGGPARSVKR